MPSSIKLAVIAACAALPVFGAPCWTSTNDLSIDFRATSGYVADPAGGFYELSNGNTSTYGAHTLANGDVCNYGWLANTSNIAGRDRNNTTYNTRVAGMNFLSPNTTATATFQLDLSGGIAGVSSNTYDIAIAIGDPGGGNAWNNYVVIKDNATALFTFAPTSPSASQFANIDGTLQTATAWNGSVTSRKTFASNTLNLVMGGTTDGTGSAVANLTLKRVAADYTISGATSGYVGITSSNIVWTKASGTWNGSTTLTVSDGGNGGTWGGACSGTSTGTATPANGLSTFNCTYTAVAAGSFLFTFTNNVSGIDPIGIIWTSSSQTITVTSFPTTGTKNVASSSFTVALNTGGTFLGPITITDGGNGGLITPSIGSPCSTPCTVAATGQANFTATYKAVVIGTMPLSTTNGSGYTNATTVNDSVTFTGSKYTAKANSATWNTSAAWNCTSGSCPDGYPVSGDQAVTSTFTVHVGNGEVVTMGTCPATTTFADLEIDSGGGVVVDSGGTFRLQGNPQLNGAVNSTTNMPVLQYSKGSTITPDACNKAVATGPFPSQHASYNQLCIGVDCSIVTTTGTAVAWVSGASLTNWPGASVNIHGTNYTVASCASAIACTLQSTAGNQTTVLAWLVQPGAAAWPTTTTVSGINTALAAPVLYNANSNYDGVTMRVYGVALANLGTASVPMSQNYLGNLLSDATGLTTSDWEYFSARNTGGEIDAGTGGNGSNFTRKYFYYTGTLGATDISPAITSGATTNICTVSDGYADAAIGTNSRYLTRCTLQNLGAFGGIFSFSTASGDKWTSFSNNFSTYNVSVVPFISGDVTTSIIWPQGTASSLHMMTPPDYSINFTSPIFWWDTPTGNEAHCIEPASPSGPGIAPAITFDHIAILPTADGHLSCSMGLGLSNNGATDGTSTVYTITNNTAVGQPVYGSLAWTGHTGIGWPTNTWLAAMYNNVVYQSGAATNQSLPLATPSFSGLSASSPANKITVASVDYNNLTNQYTSTQFSGSYDANCSPASTANNTHYDICLTSGVPGTHDSSVNPGLVDTTRTPYTASQALFGTAATLAGLQSAFTSSSPLTYGAKITSAWTWIRAGFRPTNRSLSGAGLNGFDIGAVPLLNTPKSSSGSSSGSSSSSQ